MRASSIAVDARERVVVVGPALDREGALPHLREHDRRLEVLVDPVVEPEAFERGRRHHDGVEVGGPVEPGGDVAAQLCEREVGAQRRELRAPAHRAGGRRARRRAARRASSRRATSRGSARSGTAASTRPSGLSEAGRSLAECTATSARPSSTACCTSFTKMPVPPTAWIGTSIRWSPAVDTTTSSVSGPSSAATRRACHRASSLPRVATRSGRGISGRDRRRRARTARRVRRRRAHRGPCRRRPSRGRSARAAPC